MAEGSDPRLIPLVYRVRWPMGDSVEVVASSRFKLICSSLKASLVRFSSEDLMGNGFYQNDDVQR